LEKRLVDRINQLARKQKAEGLTEEELTEQASLRKTYLQDFRAGLENTMDQIWIQNEDGEYEKLQKKD
jgi:uncharacterized protein YnzC (UPF0291/DUF896 family)